MDGKQLLIMGLARQGTALARFAVSAGAAVTVTDMRHADQLAPALAEIADLPVEIVLGEHPMRLLDAADMVAISGGVPADAPFVAAARERGLPITNDSQEFIRRTPTAVVGITGSAGKTTTTALTGVIGQCAGRRTWVGGNIGKPLISDLHKMAADDFVVQELSSFQLEIWQQSPPIAAILNITPNHLDRHKTMQAYTRAKTNILRHQRDDDIAVLSADDNGALALRGVPRGRVRLFSLHHEVPDGAFLRDGHIWLRDETGRETAVCPISDVQLRGEHNLSNVLAAVTLADSAGLPVAAMAQGIRGFSGVEHRLELVRTLDGVQYINDSIATAPERALAALHAYREPLILLAGGRDKAMQWEEWARQVRARVKKVILFGQLAPQLAEMLGDFPGQMRVESMADAVAAARETAVSGDVVLLSPGGTSFDAYVDFAARGAHFKELVTQL